MTFFWSILSSKHPASTSNKCRQAVRIRSVSEAVLQEAKTQFFFLRYHELLTKVLFRTCTNNFRAYTCLVFFFLIAEVLLWSENIMGVLSIPKRKNPHRVFPYVFGRGLFSN